MPAAAQLAQTADQAIQALSYEEPLKPGDSRYLDLSPARGEDTRRRVRKLLENKPLGQFRHVLFASHRGAGKTTELNRLQQELQSRYYAVYFEANVEMDAFAFDLEDLLLVLAAQIEERLRDSTIAIDPELLERVGQWFASVVETTAVGKAYKLEIEGQAKAGAEVPLFVSWMARVTSLLRVESEYRVQVKSELRKYPGTLLKMVNELLDAAHQSLKKHRNQELLVIIDNLDRYDPAIMDRMLVGGGDQVSQLRCNLIFTPPISLVYQPVSGSPSDFYNVEVMPSVKLREQDAPYDRISGKGVELLLGVLGQRLDLSRLVPDEADRLELVRASGGSVRELMQVTLDAFLYADGDTLSATDVSRTVSRHRGQMRTKIAMNGWAEVLARIGRTKQISSDTASLQVLFHRLAFQYNGTIWYDIHPLIAEIEEVQKASSKLP